MERCQNYGITILHPQEGTESTTAETDLIFDLVAIHGLAGDPFGTWTHIEGQPMWLRDLLPQVMPNVRIMTYGYNASFLNYTVRQDVRSIAAKLLAELADLRSGEKHSRRPIVFVCHSLGGIIAKKALLLNSNIEHSRVQESVHGVIFLGGTMIVYIATTAKTADFTLKILATPHRGSTLATYGAALATVTQYVSPLNPPRVLLDTLRQDSHALLELTADFVAKASQLQIASFYELNMTKFGPMKFMVVKESSAVLMLDHEVRIGQNSDHRGIARFSSLQDRNFRPLLRRLEIFKDEIGKKMQSFSSASPERETDSSVPAHIFECPSLPCDTFHGRKDILQQMEEYFNSATVQAHGQLSFALCGYDILAFVGGLGKSQVALKYADTFRQRYPGGIFWLSARSEFTIMADLSHICEAQRLTDGSSLSSKFKTWLLSRENMNYLLIFDSIDDPRSTQTSNYIPKTKWGHIVYTSRDQCIIGTLAKTGVLLDQLALEEAVSVLLGKAGLLEPSTEDLNCARQIAQQFGCLPLAIDQAGAYIKERRRSFSVFKRLCTQRQSDILKFKPSLAEYDQTVFTTWELNFEQVEKFSKDAKNMLLLFCYLDAANIHEAMLDRACSFQKRWSSDGEITELAPSVAGIDEDLICTVRDEIRFDNAVAVLNSFSLIYVNEDDQTGLRKFSIHPMVQYCASQRVAPEVQSYWRSQAVALICHAFPQDEVLDPFYFRDGIAQLPHAKRILNELGLLFGSGDKYPAPRGDIISLYLSTSRFGTTAWKMKALAQARKLLQDLDDPYICMLVASRESSVLRMNGETPRSDEVLENAMHKYVRRDRTSKLLFEEVKCNALAGKLIQSRAENLIFVDDLEQAQNDLDKWSPINAASPSSMEKITQVSIMLTLGRLAKIQGRFKASLGQLTPVLERIEAEDIDTGGWRRVLLALIGEVFCELGQPADAQSILVSELDCLKLSKSQNMSSGLRLQLALAESYLREYSHDRSKEVADNVRSVLESSKQHQQHHSISRRFYFRAWTVLARIAHTCGKWDEALVCWRECLKILGLMRELAGPSAAVVEFSIADIFRKQGKVDLSIEEATVARDHMDSEKERRYHFTGFDSYWRNTMVSEFSQSAKPAVTSDRVGTFNDEIRARKE